jgi:Ca2+-transporting ATPase
LFLVFAGGIYVVLGETSEAIVLCIFATIGVVIAINREFRSERVLQAMKNLASPRALLIRDGEHCRIAGRDVVRGDILIISEGDRIAADALIGAKRLLGSRLSLWLGGNCLALSRG